MIVSHCSHCLDDNFPPNLCFVELGGVHSAGIRHNLSRLCRELRVSQSHSLALHNVDNLACFQAVGAGRGRLLGRLQKEENTGKTSSV